MGFIFAGNSNILLLILVVAVISYKYFVLFHRLGGTVYSFTVGLWIKE